MDLHPHTRPNRHLLPAGWDRLLRGSDHQSSTRGGRRPGRGLIGTVGKTMSNWGASKNSRGSSRARSGGVRDLTPPSSRRREAAQAELRQAVAGREHDLIGVILIAVGMVL